MSDQVWIRYPSSDQVWIRFPSSNQVWIWYPSYDQVWIIYPVLIKYELDIQVYNLVNLLFSIVGFLHNWLLQENIKKGNKSLPKL